jgi:phosphoglycolate phosphatase
MNTVGDPKPALSGVELVVFDWDGTLMDSEARIVSSMQAAFTDLGRPTPPPAAVREVIGLGLVEAIRQLPGIGTDEPIEALMDRYRHHYLSANATPTPLFDGARSLLEDLGARGRLLAVATGKSRRGLDQALEQSGLRAHFHATRCAEETFSKPNPSMLFELMDELGVSADATLMVGDTEFDLLMAKNAGVRALAVTHGAHPAERLIAHSPSATAHSLADVARLLLD